MTNQEAIIKLYSKLSFDEKKVFLKHLQTTMESEDSTLKELRESIYLKLKDVEGLSKDYLSRIFQT